MNGTEAIAEDRGFFWEVLRRETSLVEEIRAGRNLRAMTARLILWSALGSACFGLALGFYGRSIQQVLASTLKVPILLLGTALICFPTFYVLQVLWAPRPLSPARAAALQASSLAATALIWGSFSPPILFLAGTVQHYKFAQFLALTIGTAGGLIGLGRFFDGYRILCERDPKEPRRGFLGIYFVIFAAVGGQLAWVLRPFIGSPLMGFEVFRDLKGSIFSPILSLIGW